MPRQNLFPLSPSMKVQTPPLKPFKWFKNPPANPDTPSCDVDKGMLDLLFLTARIVRSKVTNRRNVALDKNRTTPTEVYSGVIGLLVI